MPLSSMAFKSRMGLRKRFCAMMDSSFPLSSRAFSMAEVGAFFVSKSDERQTAVL